MKKYEIMYILDADLQDVKATQTKIEGILTANGGKIVEKEEWGIKEFAFKIKHKTKGFYGVLITETSVENINEFRRIERIDKNIVRAMVINTELEKNYIQSTKLSKTDMAKFKEERDNKRFGDKRPGFRREDKNLDNKSNENKEVKEDKKTSEAKPATVKKPVAPAKEKTSEAKPAATKKPAVKKEEK